MLNVKRFACLVAVLVVLVSVMSSASAFAQTQYQGPIPKYVFLFIGDGMSFPQVSSAEMFLGNLNSTGTIDTQMLNFSKFPVAGAAQTFDASSFVPDSASTATSVASGIKTLSGVINMDVTKSVAVTPFSEALKKMGYKIGVVSSVPLNHATPAAFYAKVPHRGMAYDISLQAIHSGFDYFGGGDFMRPEGDGTQRHILDVARDYGYTVAQTNEEILALNANSGKAIAINPILDGQALNYELDRKPGELGLVDFVKTGIQVLDNPRGYFLMVESGKIDWAGHANDAAASIRDTIAFSQAIEEAVKVYNNYPNDTLIIVTGDHECGGMTIGFAGTGYRTFFQVIERVTMSHREFNKIVNNYRSTNSKTDAKLEHLLPQIRIAYGLVTEDDPNANEYSEGILTDSELQRLRDALAQTMTPRDERNYTDRERIMYGGYEPLTIALTHIVNNKAGLNYSSFAHTGLPVPIYAIGAGSELFTGFYDNTDIYRKVVQIMGIANSNVPDTLRVASGL